MTALPHSASRSLRRRVVSGRVHDGSPHRDPTGTSSIARRFVSESARRVAQLKRLSREFLIEHDLLGLRQTTVTSIAQGGTDGQKINSFARWFKSAATTTLLQHGWIVPYVRACYEKGSRDAAVGLVLDEDSLATLIVKYENETDGIADVTEQQVTRAVADGLRVHDTGTKILRAVLDRIDKIAGARLDALAHFACVDAYNTAALDEYERVGIKRVGITPEHVRKRAVTDAKKRKKPTGRALGRIIAREHKLKRAFAGKWVEVLTAEDEDVCPECEEISAEGPYDIDEARGLIPAHPYCRCKFIPHEEEEE